MKTLLRKEATEFVRTWQIWVLPLVAAFFALTGPVLARYQNEILGIVLADVGTSLPDPTYSDSYAQWIKNLTQLLTFVVILTAGSAVSSELRAGTGQWILTGPIPRSQILTAKALSRSVELVGVVAATTALTYAMTLVFFPGAPAGPLVAATAVWLGAGLFLQLVTMIASALLPSGAAASGIGFGVGIGLSVIGLWSSALPWSPAGLLSYPSSLLGDQTSGWDVVTSLVVTAMLAVAVWLAGIRLFQRRDL